MCIIWVKLCAYIEVVISFFFFKQNTAYELRISDWSSDVCSSDLRMFDGGRRAFDVGARRTGEAGDGRLLALARHFAHRLEIAFGGDSKARLDNVHAQVFELVGDLQLFFQVHGTAGRLQIGRASCRERVWQYE